MVAEGAKYNAAGLEKYFAGNQARLGFAVRATILGHVQRGGEPTFADRYLATRLGAAATECIARGEYGVLVGMEGGKTVTTCLDDVVGRKKPLDTELLALAGILAQ